MKKRFRAIVNDRQIIDLTEDDALSFKRSGDGKLYVDIDNGNSNFELVSQDFLSRRYVFRINGAYYQVSLKNELEILIDELGLAQTSSSVSTDVVAPMPGLITQVLAEQGQAVKAGEGLLVLEAMKMENRLVSVRSGRIKTILVQPGDTVEKNAILIQFENDETDP